MREKAYGICNMVQHGTNQITCRWSAGTSKEK
uniref:Uncharacterized protein n=1 Tax=Setaria italica TaxID=4555 RepID=K4A4G7_SETIT